MQPSQMAQAEIMPRVPKRKAHVVALFCSFWFFFFLFFFTQSDGPAVFVADKKKLTGRIFKTLVSFTIQPFSFSGARESSRFSHLNHITS